MKVKLYGSLREHGEEMDETSGSIGIKWMDVEKGERIEDIFQRLGIDEEEVSHIFLNSEYSSPRREVNPNDELALFPRDMALLYSWYFDEKD